MEQIFLNGQNGLIAADHRALAYGDGLFETIAYRKGKLEYLDNHLQRLLLGVGRLNLNWSNQQMADLTQSIVSIADELESEHVIKIMLLRNYIGRGYYFDEASQTVDCVIQVKPYTQPTWCTQGVNVAVSGSYVSENASLVGIKHLNRLDSVMARAAVSDPSVQEVLMQTASGNIIEGAMSNVFLLMEGEWVTPLIDVAGIEGIIRNQILKAFPFIAQRYVSIQNLESVTAGFICNSLIGVVGINKLDDVHLSSHSDIEQFKREIQLT